MKVKFLSLKNLFYWIHLGLLILFTLNIGIVLLTKGYEISLGFMRISSHSAGKLFLYQIALALGFRFLFQKKESKESASFSPLKIFPERTALLLAVFLIVLLSSIMYHQTLTGYFLSDDFEFINLFSKSGSLSLNALFGHLKNSGLIRPIPLASIGIDYLFWKLNPFGFHLQNLILHMINSLLLFLIAHTLLKKAYPPLICALLFAVYPIHSEAVSWISGRFDVFCTLFYLLSLWLFLLSLRTTKRRVFLHTTSMISFIFALFCKEMALTLPLAIILLDSLFPSNAESAAIKRRAKLYMPFWVIGAVYLIFRIGYLGNLGGYSSAEGSLLTGNFLSEIGHLFSRPYVSLFVPLNRALHAHYFLLQRLILLLMALLILTIPFRKKENFQLLVFGTVWIMIAVIPLFRILFITETLEGSRFLYLPSVGASFILIAFLGSTDLRNKYSRQGIPISPLILIGFFLWAGSVHNTSWVQASKISRKISLQSLSAVKHIKPGEMIYVSGLPDNYKGAYIFRNGFPACLELIAKANLPQIIEIGKMKPGQLKEKPKYLFLEWKKEAFTLSETSYSDLSKRLTRQAQ